MLFTHAKDIKKPDFLLPAFHQEAVCVKQEHGCEQSNDITSKPQYGAHVRTAVHGGNLLVIGQCQDDVKHHHRTNAGQYIRHIGLCILFDIL